MKFEGELHPKKPKQSLPKKILLQKDFFVNLQNNPYNKKYSKNFSVRASLWIPDVPYSKIPPKIGLTLSLGDLYIRIVFDDFSKIVNWLIDLFSWIIENEEIITQNLKEAQKEHQEYRELIKKFQENNQKQNEDYNVNYVKLYKT